MYTIVAQFHVLYYYYYYYYYLLLIIIIHYCFDRLFIARAAPQEAITENAYLSALSAHFAYWVSPDVALFVLRATLGLPVLARWADERLEEEAREREVCAVCRAVCVTLFLSRCCWCHAVVCVTLLFVSRCK